MKLLLFMMQCPWWTHTFYIVHTQKVIMHALIRGKRDIVPPNVGQSCNTATSVSKNGMSLTQIGVGL